MHNWHRSRTPVRHRRSQRSAVRNVRPTLETLERRDLLSAGFLQTNLVSDISGLAAQTDASLINPWGLTASGTSPFWVADNNAGVSTLYNGAGQKIPLTVNIPPNPNDTP